MPLIELKTIISAPIKLVFDLSRDIDFHQSSMKTSKEQAIAGVTTGLIELDESVTWRAKHFGIWQHLTSKITVFNSPYYFADEMQKGAFKAFRHEHIFTRQDHQTIMIDRFHFESPLGILGKMANILFLTKYMTKLLRTRNEQLKVEAERRAKLME
ncbi:MAG: SRPBCC family protein [Flammeovirgaceae bacterium]